MDNETRVFKVSEISKPFRTYDVSSYNMIYIEGFTFPIELVSEKLKIKENRNPKSATVVDDMISRFEKAGVTLSQSEEHEALAILKTTNYYRLSVFALYLKVDTSFSQLLRLYRFDQFLRESITRLIPPIEIAIKTSLAYYLSTNYFEITEMNSLENRNDSEALVYLDKRIYKKNFVSNGKVDAMLSKFSEFITAKQDKDPSIRHHVEYYGGNIPIWVLVEHLTLGDIATMVTYLDRKIRKGWIRYLLEDTNDKWIIEWVKTIQFLRNTASHCGRFYGRKFNYNPTIHPKDQERLPADFQSEIMGEIGQSNLDKLSHTVFGGLLIMRRFYMILPESDRKNWAVFLNKLVERMEEFSADKYRVGFPDNWLEILSFKEDN